MVAVDVAGIQLFGENNRVPEFARHVDLCIDHHAGNNGYAEYTLLDAGAAATAELLCEVIEAMGVALTPILRIASIPAWRRIPAASNSPAPRPGPIGWRPSWWKPGRTWKS